MSTPTVTEIVTRPEPVAHDPFIDDLRVAREDLGRPVERLSAAARSSVAP